MVGRVDQGGGGGDIGFLKKVGGGYFGVCIESRGGGGCVGW